MRRFIAKASGALALFACVAAAPQTAFTGGDAGEGLDLQGTFLPGFAVYAGPAGETATYQIQDAVFENSLMPGGIEITRPQETVFGPGVTDAQGTTNDLNLAQITNYVRFGGAGTPEGSVGVAIDAPIVVGTQYKLQLLFNEACCTNRGFDVVVEGVLVADEFSTVAIPGDTAGDGPGSLITTTFTATDTNLDVDLLVGSGFADNNAIIDAVSLEVVPEPASIGLLALGGLALVRRRRN